MTTPASDESSSGFSARDWATVIGGAGQGVANILNTAGQTVSSKREAKENKRRTLARLMNNAINRRLKMLQAGQAYENEMTDEKTKQIHDVARGFVESLKGSTGRVR